MKTILAPTEDAEAEIDFGGRVAGHEKQICQWLHIRFSAPSTALIDASSMLVSTPTPNVQPLS